MTETSAAAAPRRPSPSRVVRADYLPALLVPVLAAAALPLIGNPTTWVTLTIAALAMGMMIFVIASGLTLVFGLMDVLNFGHGAFIAVGAYLAMTTLHPAGRLDAGRLARPQPGGAGPRHAGGDGGHGPPRLGLRARHHHAGLRPAPEADPDHHGRPDRRRAADPRVLGRRPEADAAADRAARRHHRRRRGDREVPPAGAGGRARRVRRHAAGAQPHQARAADPRRRRERRDGGGAGLPHPPPVRRRVRGGLGAGGARRHACGRSTARR